MKEKFAAKKSPALLIGFGESEPEEEDTGALAGAAFAKALKSGDGASIFSAFQSMYDECKAKSEPSEEDALDEDLPPM